MRTIFVTFVPVLSAYYFTMFDNSAKLYYNYYTCIICMFVLFSRRLTSSLIKTGSSMVSKSSSFGPCSSNFCFQLLFKRVKFSAQNSMKDIWNREVLSVHPYWCFGCFTKPQYFCWLGILFIRKIICSANSAYWIGLIHLFFFMDITSPFYWYGCLYLSAK